MSRNKHGYITAYARATPPTFTTTFGLTLLHPTSPFEYPYYHSAYIQTTSLPIPLLNPHPTNRLNQQTS